MAENVTAFSADVVRAEGKNKIRVKMNLKNNSQSYVKEETITPRNENVVKYDGDLSDIYSKGIVLRKELYEEKD